MRVEEVTLPGVGRKYILTLRDGERVVVVVHHSGKREVQVLDEDEEALATLELNDEEARELGAILAGVLFRPEAVGDIRSKLGDKVIEWFKVAPGSRLVGKALGEIPLPPGAYVLAVDRPGAPLYPNPGPGTILEPGDVLVVAGVREAVEAFKKNL